MEQPPKKVNRVLALVLVSVLPFVATYSIYTGIGILVALTKDAPTGTEKGIYLLGTSTAGVFGVLFLVFALITIVILGFAIRFLVKDRKPTK